MKYVIFITCEQCIRLVKALNYFEENQVNLDRVDKVLYQLNEHIKTKHGDGIVCEKK